MNFQTILSRLFSKQSLAACVLVILVPQAVQLLIRLAWAILIILAILLVFELFLVFAIKTWYPDRVNVSRVAEWTITTLLRVGGSLFSVFCSIVYSCFDLVFGGVWGRRQRQGTSRQRPQIQYRNDSAASPVPEQLKVAIPNRDGYTSMARKAMTNSAKPRTPSRFSI